MDLLNDKNWLEQKYLNEKLSCVAIAKILNVKITRVQTKLKCLKIPLRSQSESAKLRKGKGKRKYKILEDKKWLYNKYIIEKKSTNEIAKEIDSYPGTILKALKEFGISICSGSEAAKRRKYCSKYKELNNPFWLQEKYIQERKSALEISKLLNCSKSNVLCSLKKHKIKARTNSETHLGVIFGSKYDLLNDKDWLYQKYIVEKLSTNDICKLIEAETPNSVRQFLINANIPVRNISDGLTINREDDFLKIDVPTIEGGLLGDASLKMWNNESEESYPYFHKQNKFYDHVLFVAKNIFTKNPESRIYNSWQERYKKMYYRVRTLSHKEFLPYIKRWYPKWNNYKKVIPKDLRLSPEHLLHWFMDDGYSYIRKGRPSKQIIIGFCTDCFYKEDLERLLKQIENKFGLKARLGKCKLKSGIGWRMFLRQSQAKLFYDIIGPCPVPSMQYKWK